MIQSIHTCDRCGATSGPAAKGKGAPLTTHVSVSGLPDPVDVDLCDACRVVVDAAIRQAMRRPSVAVQQELTASAVIAGDNPLI